LRDEVEGGKGTKMLAGHGLTDLSLMMGFRRLSGT
jgi:hypothetical protein